MSRRPDAMRANPRGGGTIPDVAAFCREFGILCRHPRAGGSHDRIAHPQILDELTTPSRRPIKPIDIRRLVAFVDAVEDRG